jgi:RNA polymerase sigma-70 factor (ECF subfamily)
MNAPTAPPVEYDEARLVREAQRDIKCFEPLYILYHEGVFRFVYQRLDDKEQAFDITSQVFLNAMQRLGKYEDRGLPFGAWLYRIARNELAMFFRKNQSARTLNADSQGLQQMAEEMVEDPLASYHPALVQCIAALEENDLQMIEMRYFEKRSFRDIGEILGITENNAKVRTYRILDKLKASIILKTRSEQ